MPANLSAERKAVKQLAYLILHTIQSNMRLPYTSLVAAIVLQHVCDDGLTTGIACSVYVILLLQAALLWMSLHLFGSMVF